MATTTTNLFHRHKVVTTTEHFEWDAEANDWKPTHKSVEEVDDQRPLDPPRDYQWPRQYPTWQPSVPPGVPGYPGYPIITSQDG